MDIQYVRLKSNLEEEELLLKAYERKPQFEILSGLIQKYYSKLNEQSEYCRLYVWDTPESLKAFRKPI